MRRIRSASRPRRSKSSSKTGVWLTPASARHFMYLVKHVCGAVLRASGVGSRGTGARPKSTDHIHTESPQNNAYLPAHMVRTDVPVLGHGVNVRYPHEFVVLQRAGVIHLDLFDMTNRGEREERGFGLTMGGDSPADCTPAFRTFDSRQRTNKPTSSIVPST